MSFKKREEIKIEYEMIGNWYEGFPNYYKWNDDNTTHPGIFSHKIRHLCHSISNKGIKKQRSKV